MNFHKKIHMVTIMATILLVSSRSLGSPLVESSSQVPEDSKQVDRKEFFKAILAAHNYEKQEKQILELERELEDVYRASGLVPSDSCGGYVLLPNQAMLSFKDSRPQTTGPPTLQKCVWIVWAADSGPIGYTLMDHNFGLNTQAAIASSALRFQVGLGMTNSSVSRPISSNDEGVEREIGSSCAALVFTSYPGQSFSLRLRGEGLITAHKLVSPSAVLLNPEVGKSKTYAYPPTDSRTDYVPLENRIIVLQALAGQKIKISLDYLDTETTRDPLTVQEFSSRQDKFVFLRRFSGQLGRLRDVTFLAKENEPMLLFFQSDISLEGRGFQISYTYIPA